MKILLSCTKAKKEELQQTSCSLIVISESNENVRGKEKSEWKSRQRTTNQTVESVRDKKKPNACVLDVQNFREAKMFSDSRTDR